MSSPENLSLPVTCVGTINRQFQGWIDWGKTAYSMPQDGTKVYVSCEAKDGDVTSNSNVGDPSMLQGIEEAVGALATHPDVHRGNSIVHFVYHKLQRYTTLNQVRN